LKLDLICDGYSRTSAHYKLQSGNVISFFPGMRLNLVGITTRKGNVEFLW